MRYNQLSLGLIDFGKTLRELLDLLSIWPPVLLVLVSRNWRLTVVAPKIDLITRSPL